jgi:hypothetical protein
MRKNVKASIPRLVKPRAGNLILGWDGKPGQEYQDWLERWRLAISRAANVRALSVNVARSGRTHALRASALGALALSCNTRRPNTRRPALHTNPCYGLADDGRRRQSAFFVALVARARLFSTFAVFRNDALSSRLMGETLQRSPHRSRRPHSSRRTQTYKVVHGNDHVVNDLNAQEVPGLGKALGHRNVFAAARQIA